MVRNSPVNAGITRNTGLIPESGRSPGRGNSNPLPVFLPGKLHEQRSQQATVHGDTELDTTELLSTNTISRGPIMRMLF